METINTQTANERNCLWCKNSYKAFKLLSWQLTNVKIEATHNVLQILSDCDKRCKKSSPKVLTHLKEKSYQI